MQKAHEDGDLSWKNLFANLVHTHEHWPQLVSSCRCVPDLALSNHLFLGDVPSELKDPTVVKESMIVLC